MDLSTKFQKSDVKIDKFFLISKNKSMKNSKLPIKNNDSTCFKSNNSELITLNISNKNKIFNKKVKFKTGKDLVEFINIESYKIYNISNNFDEIDKKYNKCLCYIF